MSHPHPVWVIKYINVSVDGGRPKPMMGLTCPDCGGKAIVPLQWEAPQPVPRAALKYWSGRPPRSLKRSASCTYCHHVSLIPKLN